MPTIAPVGNPRCSAAVEEFPLLTLPSLGGLLFGLLPWFPLSVGYVSREELGIKSSLNVVEVEKPMGVGEIEREFAETMRVLKRTLFESGGSGSLEMKVLGVGVGDGLVAIIVGGREGSEEAIRVSLVLVSVVVEGGNDSGVSVEPTESAAT